MKIISYSKNPITELLVNEVKSKDFNIIKSKEEDNYKFLKNNNVNIALLDLLQFANLSKEVDVRIVPHSCIAFEGMSGLLGLEIDSNKIESFSNKTTINYLDDIVKILIKEKYKSEIVKNQTKGDLVLNFDSKNTSFDLSEDWKDTFNTSLPIYVWCVRYDDAQYELEELNQILDNITNNVNQNYDFGDGFRSGKIHLKWDPIIEKDIDDTLELLFYQNATSELFSAKLYD